MAAAAVREEEKRGPARENREQERELEEGGASARPFQPHGASVGEVASEGGTEEPRGSEVLWPVGHDELQTLQRLKELILPQNYD